MNILFTENLTVCSFIAQADMQVWKSVRLSIKHKEVILKTVIQFAALDLSSAL